MKTELEELKIIKLSNIVDMGLSFSAMIRLYLTFRVLNVRSIGAQVLQDR
jgi:hypothetical protein